MFYIRFGIAIFMVVLFSASGFAQGITVKKIVLAKFKTADDKIINLPKSSPYWPQVNYRILSMDDAGRIYLLNLWNNEILRFSKDGKLEKTIPISIKLFEKEDLNGGLQVSGDGKRFFVEGYDQSKKRQRLVLNEKGEIERKISGSEIFQGFPETRLCNVPNYYLFKQGGLLYDSNFQLLKERFSGFSDSEGWYKVDSMNHVVVKYKKDGGELWEKRFEGFLGVPEICRSGILGVVGVDNSNHLYLTGTLKKNDKYSLYRLDSKGRVTAKTAIPNPFPLLTQKEKDEWKSHSSEVPLYFFKLTCNGDVYLIFQLGQLPSMTYKRWLEGGEYYIYRFESKI